MFLFLKLYLAHVLGDFVLQFEELYRLKVRSFWGHFLHVLIHALVALALVYPYLGFGSVWAFIGAVTFVHLIQDLAKDALKKRFPRYEFFMFILDQMIHGLILGTILLLPVSQLTLTFQDLPRLNVYYGGNFWTLLLIAYILTSFGGAYLLNAFRNNYIRGSRRNYYITSFEMRHGIIERSTVTTFFLFANNPLWILFSLSVVVLRFFSPRLKNAFDFVASFICAGLIGLMFRLWI